MNKTVDGTQCSALWQHVDDLKMSHVDGSANEHVLERLNDQRGKETPLTVAQGGIHERLGMTQDAIEQARSGNVHSMLQKFEK